QQALESMSCDVLILDEINVAVEWNLISVKDLLAMIEKKPSGVELILTGRYAHPDVLKVADLVTEMIERKHYYSTKQLTARKGFEF
ncbi:MAG: cob(I)yrinic acid a,c-diamide adenosyltransferase, partial [Candidatus Thorarchaeota archaeon]